MGQFENYGVEPIGQIGLPKKGNRSSLETYTKPKPKNAPAAAPAAPPAPPKDNPNKKKK